MKRFLYTILLLRCLESFSVMFFGTSVAMCRQPRQNVLSSVRKNCWSLAREWDWEEYIGVASTFCIGIMHPAREFSTTSKTLQCFQCTLLRRFRRQMSLLLPSSDRGITRKNIILRRSITSRVTESPEEENSWRYSCKSGKTSRGIYFRGDNRNCHENRKFTYIEKLSEKIRKKSKK